MFNLWAINPFALICFCVGLITVYCDGVIGQTPITVTFKQYGISFGDMAPAPRRMSYAY